MRHIKKFEFFDFNQTLPITTKNYLTNFYCCDECDHMWQELQSCNICPECESTEIEDLPEDEWYEVAKSRNPEEVESLNNRKIKDSDSYLNIGNLDKN